MTWDLMISFLISQPASHPEVEEVYVVDVPDFLQPRLSCFMQPECRKGDLRDLGLMTSVRLRNVKTCIFYSFPPPTKS